MIAEEKHVEMIPTPVNLVQEASAGSDAAILHREDVCYDSIYWHGARRTNSVRRLIRSAVALYVACLSRAPQQVTADGQFLGAQ